MFRPYSIVAGGLATVFLVATAMLAGAATSAEAQQSDEGAVVSVDWLAEHLTDADLVLLHVGREETYGGEHIPGARHVALSDLSAPEDHEAGTGLSLQMPDPDTLAAALEGLGVGDRSRVVVYFADDWVSAATRVLLTLDWIGLGARASLLDGGMPAWRAAGHAVTDEEPAPVERGTLTPRVRRDLIVSAAWVDEHRSDPAYAVVDARSASYYDGLRASNLHRQPVRKGHIPGAVNIPYNELWADDLTLKPEAELRAVFEAAGVREGQTVVGYCHLGQFATAMLLGARVLGHEVKLYDGSFQEWGSREALPVESRR